MENKNENEGFRYTYSATEQAEIKKIREKYTPREENKMERLRRLDNSATGKAQIISLVFGVIGALVLGFGMSLIMSELGAILGSKRDMAMPIGIIVGVIGVALVCLAYPMYNIILKRERDKIAPEIIKLTDELMK
ncbi:MAG: hypothetical protein IJ515_03295 [Clostridia bacterium]|nr:hypothetical protein [Clostridia bacterium]